MLELAILWYLSFGEFAQFCQKVRQQWLLSQPDSGLKSESSETANFIEKIGPQWFASSLLECQNGAGRTEGEQQ